VEVVSVDREGDVINRWISLLRRESVDVMIGYNTHQFDWKYVHGRADVCVDDATGRAHVHLGRLGRVMLEGGKSRTWQLNSNGMGQNEFFVLTTPGVLQIDLLQYVRREHKLASYSLNNVSMHFLNDKFRGTAEDRAVIASYAAKDTELPLRLVSKLSVLENLMEMANAGGRAVCVCVCVCVPHGLGSGRYLPEQHHDGPAAAAAGGPGPAPGPAAAHAAVWGPALGAAAAHAAVGGATATAAGPGTGATACHGPVYIRLQIFFVRPPFSRLLCAIRRGVQCSSPWSTCCRAASRSRCSPSSRARPASWGSCAPT
jgi:hypothetical protein